MAGEIARPGLGQRLAMAWKSAVATFGGNPHGPVNWTRNGGIPTSWNWNFWQQNMRPFQGGESATVNACVNAYAMTLAQLPGAHRRDLADGGAETVNTSALSRILRSPNGYQTRSDFILNLVTGLLFHGNAYAWAQRNARQEVEALHLMPSRLTTPYYDPDSRAIFYALAENPLAPLPDYLVPQRDVMHIRCRTRQDRPLEGITPITWATLAQASNVAISATQAAFFNNASQPSGFLSSKEKLSGDQMDALRAAWADRASGIAQGSVPILGGGLEFQQTGITSQDAQLVEAFGMTVADIARAFAVPLPIIGDLSNATFNNVENLIGLWLSQGLGFYVEHIEIAFDKFFGLPVGEYVEFDTDTLLRTQFKDLIEGLSRAAVGGILSPDEARRRFDRALPPAPGGFGKEPRVQAQVVPLSQVGAEPAPSAEVPPVAPAAPVAEDQAAAAQEAAKALGESLQRLGEDMRVCNVETAARLEALADQLKPQTLDTSQALGMIRAAMANRKAQP